MYLHARSFITLPLARDLLERKIGVLQQLQVLLPPQATLDDVVQFLLVVQQDFGTHAALEEVIQRLVGEHLAQQMRVSHEQADIAS